LTANNNKVKEEVEKIAQEEEDKQKYRFAIKGMDPHLMKMDTLNSTGEIFGEEALGITYEDYMKPYLDGKKRKQVLKKAMSEEKKGDHKDHKKEHSASFQIPLLEEGDELYELNETRHRSRSRLEEVKKDEGEKEEETKDPKLNPFRMSHQFKKNEVDLDPEMEWKRKSVYLSHRLVRHSLILTTATKEVVEKALTSDYWYSVRSGADNTSVILVRLEN